MFFFTRNENQIMGFGHEISIILTVPHSNRLMI